MPLPSRRPGVGDSGVPTCSAAPAPGSSARDRLPLTAIGSVKRAPSHLARTPELAANIPELEERHRITREDRFSVKLDLRSLDALRMTLDRFLVEGDATTSLINTSTVTRRDPPLPTAR